MTHFNNANKHEECMVLMCITNLMSFNLNLFIKKGTVKIVSVGCVNEWYDVYVFLAKSITCMWFCFQK